MESLTIKEALKQGYTHCGSSSKEFQMLDTLESITDEDIREDTVLADKKSTSPLIDADQIKEMIAEQMEESHSQDTGDDTNQVYDTVMKLDFSKTAEFVNKELEVVRHWFLTDVKLKQE